MIKTLQEYGALLFLEKIGFVYKMGNHTKSYLARDGSLKIKVQRVLSIQAESTHKDILYS